MTALSPGMSWDAALEQLTALPGQHHEAHGATNFMRAGAFRRNGRHMFREKIHPLLSEGRTFEVVAGFVDAAIAEEAGLGFDDGYFGSPSSQFLAARLRDTATGEIVDICASEDPQHK